jgi:quercetin dioxygenase-like cupin family protein
MRWIELDQGDVDEYGSTGLHLIEVARLTADTHFRTHIARVAPGGALGRHPGRWWQLFCVADGTGWVSGADGVRRQIGAGQAVLWEPGESHESGSDCGMTVVVVQSALPLPYGESSA